MEIPEKVILEIIKNDSAEDFEYVDQIINSVDEYDGGADYTLITKQISTGKFYRLDYCEWDERCWDKDNDNTLTAVEVFPHQVTMTVYKTYAQ